MDNRLLDQVTFFNMCNFYRRSLALWFVRGPSRLEAERDESDRAIGDTSFGQTT